jgi:general stress protein 26
MPTDAEITRKFWKAVKSDRTVMLGARSTADDETRPMTAQLADDAPEGPIWFFTATDTELVRELGAGGPAGFEFSSKGHDLFASVRGRLTPVNDRAMIEKLWNPFVAAWYEHGMDDPKLQLLRFDADHAHIWLDENSLFAGVKMLLGRDPKKDYADKVAEVPL